MPRSSARGKRTSAAEVEVLGLTPHALWLLVVPGVYPVLGATEAQAEGYKKGLQRGGALVFATGTEADVEIAAGIMNREGAVRIAEGSGPEPYLPIATNPNMTPIVDSPVLAGRIREPGGGARFFVW